MWAGVTHTTTPSSPKTLEINEENNDTISFYLFMKIPALCIQGIDCTAQTPEEKQASSYTSDILYPALSKSGKLILMTCLP